MSFSVDFDIEVWAKWAEFEGLDSRTINFALSNPEIFKTNVKIGVEFNHKYSKLNLSMLKSTSCRFYCKKTQSLLLDIKS